MVKPFFHLQSIFRFGRVSGESTITEGFSLCVYMQATGDPVADGPLEGSLILQQSFHFVGQVSGTAEARDKYFGTFKYPTNAI